MVLNALSLLVFLSAAPPSAEVAPDGLDLAQPASDVRRVFVLELESQTVGAEALSVINGRIATTLEEDPRLEVVTNDDVKRMADLEATRELVGCETDSCLAEIAGALGAELVIVGRVAAIDGAYHLQLTLFDASAARSVGRREAVADSLSATVDQTTYLTASLVAALFGDAAPVAAVAVEEETGGGESTGLLPTTLLVAGGAMAALGAVALVGGAAAAAGSVLAFGQTQLDVSIRQAAQLGLFGGALMAVVGVPVIGVGAGVAASSLFVE